MLVHPESAMKGEGWGWAEVEDRDVLTDDGIEFGMETAWMKGKGVVIGRRRWSRGGRVKESSAESSSESSDSKVEKGLG
jgi:hypothetical protein